MSINRIIVGNLVANPNLRNTHSGTPVASATIATNEFCNDGEGERRQLTTFYRRNCLGKAGFSPRVINASAWMQTVMTAVAAFGSGVELPLARFPIFGMSASRLREMHESSEGFCQA